MRKAIAALAIAFALGGSCLSTCAFALANAYHGDHASNVHRRVLPSHERGQQRDPWGHFGAYYGPMVGPVL